MLHIILGPMFSGKTSYLLNELERYKLAQVPTLAVCHSFDKKRKMDECLQSHNHRTHPAIHCETLSSILGLSIYKNAQVIGIDEAQFFSDLLPIVTRMVDQDNKKVYVAGLDGSSSRREFGSLLFLVPHCDSVVKLNAVCQMCPPGNFTSAPFTIYLLSENQESGGKGTIDIGGNEKYRSVCRKHYIEYQKK